MKKVQRLTSQLIAKQQSCDETHEAVAKVNVADLEWQQGVDTCSAIAEGVAFMLLRHAWHQTPKGWVYVNTQRSSDCLIVTIAACSVFIFCTSYKTSSLVSIPKRWSQTRLATLLLHCLSVTFTSGFTIQAETSQWFCNTQNINKSVKWSVNLARCLVCSLLDKTQSAPLSHLAELFCTKIQTSSLGQAQSWSCPLSYPSNSRTFNCIAEGFL